MTISRSSDSFSSVSQRVNCGDWRCIVHDLQTIVILVLLVFNSSPKGTPLNNLNEVTVHGLCNCNPITPGNDTTANNVKSSAYPVSFFSRMEITQKCTGATTSGRKHCPAPWVALSGGIGRWSPRMLKVARSILRKCCTDLYCARCVQGMLPMRMRVTARQLDLLYLTPSVAGCGRLQLGVAHWATSVP